MLKIFSNVLFIYKKQFLFFIVILSVFMLFEATKSELSYAFVKILPDNDSTFIEYNNFKKQFGEDGVVMTIGFIDKNIFNQKKFNDFILLNKKIKGIKGIKGVLSIVTSFKFKKIDSLQKFEIIPLLNKNKYSQTEIDSLKKDFYNLPFYDGIIYNKQTGANLLAITFNKKENDSKKRLQIVNEIKEIGDKFAIKYNLNIHYSGLPYIRSQIMNKVAHEMTLFLLLAVIITSIILRLFFKSFSIVFYSLIVVIIGVIWSFGLLVLFDYKITILSSLISPLIIVIGLPNCIFLINKYHAEFILQRNKLGAIKTTIETVGLTLFLANITTAIGFGVLFFTKSNLLVEFGIISALSVFLTYIITLILIPIILYFLPDPKNEQIINVNEKLISKFLNVITLIVQKKRKIIYFLTIIITIIAFFGIYLINLNGYVIDDLPVKDKAYIDLKFFEKNFNGVLPFEITIDTKVRNGLFKENAKAIYKIKLLEKVFASDSIFSKPISAIELIKFTYQTYKGGDQKFYKLPSISDLKILSEFKSSLKNQNEKLESFIDSNKQITRISYQMADIGSKEMKAKMTILKPKIDSIFNPNEYKLNLTGHSLVFLKSNDYLLTNLLESLLIEIILIAIVGIALFRSVRIILFSKLPCLIPLIITAGIMGFLDIRFKPSTILIFSIAFGISSDGTIYFLSKFREELKKQKNSLSEAISITIKETGLSMIYTTIILFCGFVIFSISDFGATKSLGILISVTLIFSLFTNLILLPAILLSINSKKTNF